MSEVLDDPRTETRLAPPIGEAKGVSVGGPMCPIGDGRHKLKVWSEVFPLSAAHVRITRSGFACERCSKTWEWDRTDRAKPILRPTYAEKVA